MRRNNSSPRSSLLSSPEITLFSSSSSESKFQDDSSFTSKPPVSILSNPSLQETRFDDQRSINSVPKVREVGGRCTEAIPTPTCSSAGGFERVKETKLSLGRTSWSSTPSSFPPGFTVSGSTPLEEACVDDDGCENGEYKEEELKNISGNRQMQEDHRELLTYYNCIPTIISPHSLIPSYLNFRRRHLPNDHFPPPEVVGNVIRPSLFCSPSIGHFVKECQVNASPPSSSSPIYSSILPSNNTSTASLASQCPCTPSVLSHHSVHTSALVDRGGRVSNSTFPRSSENGDIDQPMSSRASGVRHSVSTIPDVVSLIQRMWEADNSPRDTLEHLIDSSFEVDDDTQEESPKPPLPGQGIGRDSSDNALEFQSSSAYEVGTSRKVHGPPSYYPLKSGRTKSILPSSQASPPSSINAEVATGSKNYSPSESAVPSPPNEREETKTSELTQHELVNSLPEPAPSPSRLKAIPSSCLVVKEEGGRFQYHERHWYEGSKNCDERPSTVVEWSKSLSREACQLNGTRKTEICTKGVQAKNWDVSRRQVSSDYPIPSWMMKNNVFVKDYKCPYQYNKTFIGKYGVINYDIAGNPNDPLMVCFHGLNATRLTFQDIHDTLSKYDYRVLTFGGVIAAGFAQKHSSKVDRLVLISTAGMLSKSPPPPVKLLGLCRCLIPCAPKCVCRCCCRRQRFMKKFQKEEIDSGMAEALWSRLMWQLFVKKGVVEAFLGCVANVPMWGAGDMFRAVGKTNIPVLILWGREDVVAPVSAAKCVLSCFPNGHLIVFEKSGHLLLADQPQASIALLLTFLEFPKECNLKEWRYLLPFSPRGVYVPREARRVEGFTAKEFLKHLNFRPRFFVKLPSSSPWRTAGQQSSVKPTLIDSTPAHVPEASDCSNHVGDLV